MFKKVDCVMLPVPDLEEGIDFYQGKLGHRLIWRSAEAAGLQLPDTDAEIVLRVGQSAIEVDFLVDNADEAAREYEMAGGKVVVPPFDIQIGRAVVVSDPWGNPYVLLDMTKGRLITDENGHILGNLDPA